jgi:hypothetical protein
LALCCISSGDDAAGLFGGQITLAIPSADLVGSRIVAVANPPLGGGTTVALTPFEVNASLAPPPQQP